MFKLKIYEGKLALWDGEHGEIYLEIGDRKAVQEFILNLQEQLKIMEEKK